ncbi:MAG: class I adenylate-forming enzyme family protein, partial [Alphaproteobacteria bacterium]|nr:class I adenylate-forming enzyme family protein [Alphaproteobacteria bacterium]
MPRGLTRRQLGVTAETIDSYGQVIFELSHNLQVRHGDPVRELDFTAIAARQADLGLTDRQIADRIGLDEVQVMYIRTVMERRRFRTGHYHRLLELGGGRRFRAERFTPHEDRFQMSEEALRLRAAMAFDPERVRHYVDNGWWAGDTLGGWLARHAEERPERPALLWDGEAMSYGELARRVDSLAGGLHRLGLRKGDVVAVQLPNLPEYLICFLAIARLGAVMTTLYMPHREREFETLLGHSRARAVICLADAGGFAAAACALGLRAGLPNLGWVVALGGAVDGAVPFGDLLDGDPSADAMAIEGPSAADPFLLLYTSGTTASPKAVPHNYHTMLSNARLGLPEHGLGEADILLSAAPFGHLFALYSFHLALCAGAANLLLPAFTPPDLAQAVAAGRPTALFAAPAHIAACIGLGLLEQHDFSSLRLTVLSGSAVPSELARAFAGKLPDCAVTQLWGMTETQAGLYCRPGDGIEVAATSAGGPSPGTEARIVDEDGRALADGEEGELQCRGALLFPGYFDNDDANRAAFTDDGWFRSGDLAVRDAAGNIAITGRIKDIINRGGVKYNPREIEELLDQHHAVQQS